MAQARPEEGAGSQGLFNEYSPEDESSIDYLNEQAQKGKTTSYSQSDDKIAALSNKYAEMLDLSKDRVSVIFKNRFGHAPYQYQIMLKTQEATDLLLHTDLSIGEIAEKLGYKNQLYFSTAYRKQTGVAPTDMRKRKKVQY